MKHLKLFAALCCLSAASFLFAAEVPAVVALSSDGSRTSYELSTVLRIVPSAGGFALVRSGALPEVSGVRCVFFGTMEQTSLAEARKAALCVYPNPVQHYLCVEGAAADATCTVYDLQGRALLHSAAQHIDVTALQQGSYLLKINDQIIKFIKK